METEAGTGRRKRGVVILGIISAIAVSAAALYLLQPPEDATPVGPQQGTLEVAGGGSIEVEIVRSEAERQQGLMNRTVVPLGTGMVFLYPGPVQRGFWMKDTSIPLRIAFWDAEGTVVRVMDMAPCNAAECPTYDPGVAYTGAIEASPETFTQAGLVEGARVDLQEPA